MRKVSVTRGLLLGVVFLLAVAGSASAEEMRGRWRIEFGAGGVDPEGRIRSDANNVTIWDAGSFLYGISDPRPDKASLLEGRLSADARYEIRASYGIGGWKNGEWILDFGVARFKAEVANIEFAYELDRLDPKYTVPQRAGNGQPIPGRTKWAPDCTSIDPASWFDYDLDGTVDDQEIGPRAEWNCKEFDRTPADGLGGAWQFEALDAGTLTVYPVSVNLIARFRPTKRFNPYLGGGLGYYIVSFKETARFSALADQLGASFVTYVKHTRGADVTERYLETTEWINGGVGRRMKRPRVETPNTLFLETKGGFEWQWRQKTALFVETRFSWAKDNIEITADGRQQFGRATPNRRFTNTADPAFPPVGGTPAYITQGGIKKILRAEDGTILGNGPWPGEYYLNGGKLDYGGWTFTAGIRLTL